LSFFKPWVLNPPPHTTGIEKNNKLDYNIPTMADFMCPQCKTGTQMEDFVKNYRVCPSCSYHSRLTWRERLDLTADEGSFIEFDQTLDSENPIGYPGYREKITELQKENGIREAVVTGRCTIAGYPAVLGIMDSHFMMASLGSVVGEKIARAFEYGTEHRLPVIIFTASGGARMQEGVISLMQMAKTSGAVARHNLAGELYITVMTDPTTGGVTASFASLGDIIIAEPGVLIGFAGKRVIQGTIGQALPEKFQTAEFVYEHGFVDIIARRDSLQGQLARLLRLHGCRAGDERNAACQN
jgi:acetyl-CoA carboxylase carboxyl transferase subunit beta